MQTQSKVTTPIYLDYQATTPLDPQVFEAMKPYFEKQFGNPSSRTHRFGWEADAAVEKARKQVASLIGAKESEIVFTSGGTESNNLAIQGVAFSDWGQKRKHLVTSQVEHKSVLATFKTLEKSGFAITVLPVNSDAMVDPQALQAALRPDTCLVSLMAVNNEVGTLNAIQELASICRSQGVLFHTDAVQAVGKLPVQVESYQCDFLSLSAHKFYGPKGVGALYVRGKGSQALRPLFCGGGQECGMRSGTLNVPGIVGLGTACQFIAQDLEKEHARISDLRKQMMQELQTHLKGVTFNGHPTQRIPHNVSVTLEGVSAELIITMARDLAISTSSACMSAGAEKSHVLSAMGYGNSKIQSTLRISFGRFTTVEEVAFASRKLIDIVNEIQK